MGHEPRGFIAMKQNGVTMKQYGIFCNGMMKNAIFHHGMMKNAILHHGVMKNGICLMVSDAKLCNNVANYGTKRNCFILLKEPMKLFKSFKFERALIRNVHHFLCHHHQF